MRLRLASADRDRAVTHPPAVGRVRRPAAGAVNGTPLRCSSTLLLQCAPAALAAAAATQSAARAKSSSQCSSHTADARGNKSTHATDGSCDNPAQTVACYVDDASERCSREIEPLHCDDGGLRVGGSPLNPVDDLSKEGRGGSTFGWWDGRRTMD